MQNRRDLSRREFLCGTAGLGVAAFATGCASSWFVSDGPAYAAQLYSIHKIFWQKPEWCLAGLKAGGFAGVEFAGYADHTAKEIAKLLADAGLRGMGTHVNGNVDLVGDGLKRTLDFCAAAGIEAVTTPHAKKDSADEYRRFGHDMGLAAEAAAAYGIKVGIHTTYHHFTTKYDGVTAWDLMFSDASPLLQQQIDTSNTFHTGTDVVALLRKYRGRHHSVHLKENTPSKTATIGEPPTDGGPLVPWDDVLGYLATEKVAWYVIEAEKIPDSLSPLIDSLRFVDARRAAIA